MSLSDARSTALTDGSLVLFVQVPKSIVSMLLSKQRPIWGCLHGFFASGVERPGEYETLVVEDFEVVIGSLRVEPGGCKATIQGSQSRIRYGREIRAHAINGGAVGSEQVLGVAWD